MSVIREPEGIDFVVSRGDLDRQAVLETAEWLNAYRQQHDQSADLERALDTIRRASQQAREKKGQ